MVVQWLAPSPGSEKVLGSRSSKHRQVIRVQLKLPGGDCDLFDKRGMDLDQVCVSEGGGVVGRVGKTPDLPKCLWARS